MNNKKNIDCIKMKEEIYEALYNELQPKSGADYLIKLKKKIEESKLKGKNSCSKPLTTNEKAV